VSHNGFAPKLRVTAARISGSFAIVKVAHASQRECEGVSNLSVG
jgi:hypothetical protein